MLFVNTIKRKGLNSAISQPKPDTRHVLTCAFIFLIVEYASKQEICHKNFFGIHRKTNSEN